MGWLRVAFSWWYPSKPPGKHGRAIYVWYGRGLLRSIFSGVYRGVLYTSPTKSFSDFTIVGNPLFCYTSNMENQRPLCTAENNTCKNLAENKGRTRSGAIKYGRYCDTHRRKGHVQATQKKYERRYIELDACEMCLHKKATDRHRIISGGEYSKKNVINLCKECHNAIHRFYSRIKTSGFRVQ